MDTKSIDAERLQGLLEELGERLAAGGEVLEIALYGGAALMLSFAHRRMSDDVDFVRLHGDPMRLTGPIHDMARAHGLAEDWLNDAVEIFVSEQAEHRHFGDFPRHGLAGLRVFVAAPAYLFAMKALSLRDPFATSDLEDIWHLADVCEVSDSEAAAALVDKFYPGRLPRRHALILEDIFEAKRQGQPYSPMLGW